MRPPGHQRGRRGLEGGLERKTVKLDSQERLRARHAKQLWNP
jgi:hypothetical protein